MLVFIYSYGGTEMLKASIPETHVDWLSIPHTFVHELMVGFVLHASPWMLFYDTISEPCFLMPLIDTKFRYLFIDA